MQGLRRPKEVRHLVDALVWAAARVVVLKKRQEIIRALCEQVIIWSDRRVKLVGVLDGTGGAQFDLAQFLESSRRD